MPPPQDMGSLQAYIPSDMGTQGYLYISLAILDPPSDLSPEGKWHEQSERLSGCQSLR